MDGILDLFESVAESPRHGEYLDEFLKSCTEHQAFSVQKSGAVQPFIKFTNSKLNIQAERPEGLLLLRTFLPQCSDEQFTDNAITWMLQCVKGIETKACIQTNGLSYDVLRMLLEMSSNFKEMVKNVNNSIISKFVEQLQRSEAKPQVKMSALRCVQVLIRNYGAPCSTHKNAIEKFILQFADSKDDALVSAAARCFSLLPLVSGGGTLGTNHKTRWLEQQQRTCSTLRFLLDQLFEHVEVVDSFVQEVNHDKLPLELLTDMNPVIRVHQIANRFINVAKFLEAMMLGEFPVTKSVLPDQIIGVVCRGLSVDCTVLGSRVSSDLLAVSSVLPKVHLSLLRVMQALIACLGKNLYPYARLICKLSLQSLKWTTSATKSYALTRPYASLRVGAYRMLEAWLRAAKAGSCVELVADELFAVMVDDVHTKKITVKLAVQVGKKSKKLRKQLAAKEAESPDASKVATTGRDKLCNKLANQGPCLAALDVLYWIIHSAGVLLKPTLHKAIQETVLTVLFDVQRSCKLDMPIPYSSADCRLAAYKLLLALTMEPHASWPPPTQFALHVLAHGQTDVNAQVSGYCTVALSSVEKVIHPVSQTLIFPVSLEEMHRAVKLDEPKNNQTSVDLTDDHERNVSIPSNVSTTNSTSVRNIEESDEELNNELDRSSKLSNVSSVYSLNIDMNDKTNDFVTSPEVFQSAPPPAPSSPTDKGVKRKTPEVDTKQQSAKRSVSFGLLGDSEVSKKPRIEKKVIDISSNDPDVVDLSSGEDDDISLILTESNISVASSNSNYQDSVLNKSTVSETLEPQDKNDDIEVETPKSITLGVEKSLPKKRIVQTRVYIMENKRTSPRKSVAKSSKEVIQEVVLMDDGDVEIVESEKKDEEAKENVEEVCRVNGKEKTVESFDGMTDDQVVDMVMEDFVTLL